MWVMFNEINPGMISVYEEKSLLWSVVNNIIIRSFFFF